MAFGCSLGPIVWLYLPEIVPDAGVSASCIANWLFTSLVGLLFPIIKNSSVQLRGTFLLFSAFSFFGVIYMHIFVHETKGKTGDEIVKAFQEKTSSKEYNNSFEDNNVTIFNRYFFIIMFFRNN